MISYIDFINFHKKRKQPEKYQYLSIAPVTIVANIYCIGTKDLSQLHLNQINLARLSSNLARLSST